MSGRFEPRHAVRHIVLVGVGGTGSALARSVARMLFDMDRRGMHLPTMTLIDPDIIEERNVGRQSGFAPSDVGHSKAEVLARRFNLALGLSIEAIATPFDPEIHHTSYGTLLVGCVDNHEARRSLSHAKCMTLDCGNHATEPVGQVAIGSTSNREQVLRELDRMADRDGVITQLPSPYLVFPDLLQPEEEPEPDLSCQQRAEQGRQHILINDCVATTAAGYIWRLLHRQPLTSFASFISLQAVRPVVISAEEISHYIT